MGFIYKIFFVLLFGQVCGSASTKPLTVIVKPSMQDPSIIVAGGEPYYVRSVESLARRNTPGWSFAHKYFADKRFTGYNDKQVKLIHDKYRTNSITLSLTNTYEANEITVDRVDIKNNQEVYLRSLGRALACFVEAYTSRVGNVKSIQSQTLKELDASDRAHLGYICFAIDKILQGNSELQNNHQIKTGIMDYLNEYINCYLAIGEYKESIKNKLKNFDFTELALQMTAAAGRLL
jgi:hypothetical protein